MNNSEVDFNAPSRHAIWYRIHKLAYGKDWNGTYEDFVAYDAINRNKGKKANAPRKSRSSQPPVVTGRTWSQARK